MQIPKGHQQVMPYLILNNAAKFIEFTKAIFGAELLNTHMRDENKIMHAEINIGGNTIMFADATEQYPPATGGFFVYVEDADKSYARSLEEGATSIMGLSDQSYGRTCGVLDPTGNTWWITSVVVA